MTDTLSILTRIMDEVSQVYLSKVRDDAQKIGPGLGLFRSTNGSMTKYHYIGRGTPIWNIILDAADDSSKRLLSKAPTEGAYVVAVALATSGSSEWSNVLVREVFEAEP